MSTTKKIRAGLVGIGNWGRYGHVPILKLLPEFEICRISALRSSCTSSST